MASLIGSLLRKITRQTNDPLNILCCPTHESYETGLAKTGHNFYAVRGEGIKNWETKYRPLPRNYTLLNPDKKENQVPPWVSLDLVLCHNRFAQYNVLKHFAQRFHLPMVCVEHCYPTCDGNGIQMHHKMTGDINVFISLENRNAWDYGGAAEIIHHGIDTELFKPSYGLRENSILTVGNDFINRGALLGYDLWDKVTSGLNRVVVGDTKGLSKPATSVDDLVSYYQRSSIYINPSLVSPIPSSLLEAMACGCAIVTTDNSMMSTIIEDGVNGFKTNNPGTMRKDLELLLENKELAINLGLAARQTVLKRFPLHKFIVKWNELLYRASKMTYTG